MRFFDCNCRMGFEASPPIKHSDCEAKLLSELDFFGIDCALVTSSRDFYFSDKESAFSSNRLLPVLNFQPYGNADCYNDNMKDTLFNYKAIRFQPIDSRFPLDCNLFREQLSLMEKRKIPFLLDLNHPGREYTIPYRQLDFLLEEFPSLPVVLLNTSYRIDSILFPLLKKHRSLRIELSGYQGFRAIEEVAERFGAYRILFGSRYPYFYPGAAMLRVETLALSMSDRERIAYKNIEELLGGITNDC